MALPGDSVIFSSDPTDPWAAPFELVITGGGTELAVYLPGIGLLPSALTPLNPGETNMVGVRYWYESAEHHWEYIVNGVVEDGTGPMYVAAVDGVDVNVISIAADIGLGPFPGYTTRASFDEIMYWPPDNGLTDLDITKIWQSYTYYPNMNGWDDEAWGANSGGTFVPFRPTNGWVDEHWGTPSFVPKAPLEALTFTSCVPCNTFESESPCVFNSCQGSC